MSFQIQIVKLILFDKLGVDPILSLRSPWSKVKIKDILQLPTTGIISKIAMGEVFARGEHQAYKISETLMGEVATMGGSRKLGSFIFCMILKDYIFWNAIEMYSVRKIVRTN